MKHTFHAIKEIKDENAKTLIKQGEVAVTIETTLPLDRVTAGLQTGRFVPEKDLPKPEKKAAAKSSDAAAPANSTK